MITLKTKEELLDLLKHLYSSQEIISLLYSDFLRRGNTKLTKLSSKIASQLENIVNLVEELLTNLNKKED